MVTGELGSLPRVILPTFEWAHKGFYVFQGAEFKAVDRRHWHICVVSGILRVLVSHALRPLGHFQPFEVGCVLVAFDLHVLPCADDFGIVQRFAIEPIKAAFREVTSFLIDSLYGGTDGWGLHGNEGFLGTYLLASVVCYEILPGERPGCNPALPKLSEEDARELLDRIYREVLFSASLYFVVYASVLFELELVGLEPDPLAATVGVVEGVAREA